MAAADEFAVVGFTDGREVLRRSPRLVVGLLLLGTGIAMTLQARLGVSPWDVLHQGLADTLDVNFGVVVVAVGVVVLAGWVPLRQRPGVGTVVNTLTVGFVTAAGIELIGRVDGTAARWSLLLGGVLVAALGVGVYIGCGLGPGPRDGLMTGLAARGHPVWLVRTLLELGACAAGFALGGDVGIGTLVFAFGIGPAGHWCLRRFHLAVGDADPDPDAAFGE
jgi:uncharacterized membrane protein YczE